MTAALRLLDLFSGIGGFSYAAERLVGGFRTVAFCDVEPFAQQLLALRWPGVPIYGDVRGLAGQPGVIDVITAGFPCQDLSSAGKGLGFAGSRSVLFYEVIRLAREFRPRFLLLENVRGLLSHADGETFQEVLFQIAKAGFDAEWAVIPASDVGACHRRDRIWIVAYTQGGRWGEGERKSQAQAGYESQRASNSGGTFAAPDAHYAGLQGQWTQRELCECGSKEQVVWRSRHRLSSNWRGYLSEPVLCRGDDGLFNRVDRLKALGNSIVPQVAAIPLQRIRDIYEGGCVNVAA